MPVWYKGGIGGIEDHVISQSTVELEYGETGWLYVINFDMPEQAFVAEINEEGDEIYVGRSVIDGDLIPGMIVVGKQLAMFSNNAKVVTKDDKHVLCGIQMRWAKRMVDRMHPRAVIGGRTFNGEQLFIGKTTIENKSLIGRIVPSKNLQLFVPYGNKEAAVLDYEVLVHGYPD